MKKVFALALVMAFSLTLSACNKSETTPTPAAPENNAMENTVPTTPTPTTPTTPTEGTTMTK